MPASLKAVTLVSLALLTGAVVLIWAPPEAQEPTRSAVGDASPHRTSTAHETGIADPEADRSNASAYGGLRSLADELLEATRLAESGDAIAMRRVGEILSDCYPVIMSGAAFVPRSVSDAKSMSLSEADIARTEQLAKMLAGACAGVEGGQPYPNNMPELSIREAAANGDLAALVAVAGLESALESDARVNELATLAIKSNDSAALLALYNYLPPDSRVVLEGINGVVSPAALAIHACRSNPSTCGPNSRFVVASCLQSFQCNANSMEEVIRRYHLTPSEAEQVSDELRRLKN